MSSEEWVEDDEPTNFLGKIGRFLFPKKKKKAKKEVAPIVVETAVPETPPITDFEKGLKDAALKGEEPQIKPEEPSPIKTKHDKKGKKNKNITNEEEWVEEKVKKYVNTPDLSRGLPGNLTVKRGVATILFLIYMALLIYVVKFELFSTVICIASIIIILDYLAITRGKQEWVD